MESNDLNLEGKAYRQYTHTPHTPHTRTRTEERRNEWISLLNDIKTLALYRAKANTVAGSADLLGNARTSLRKLPDD